MSSQQSNLSETGNIQRLAKTSFSKRMMQRLQILYHAILGHYRLQKMVTGLYLTQVIYVTAQLGLADQLSQGSKTVDELADILDVDIHGLRHLMLLLTNQGIVSLDKDGNYKLTSLGAYLRSDTPNSMRGTVLSFADLSPAWSNLLYSIQTGKPGMEKAFQMSLYEYLSQNSEANTNFSLFTEESTREWVMPTLDTCNFSHVKTFVDVGGNTGMLVAMILKQYPNMRAILFDQPHVVSDAGRILESANVADRCDVIGGDFFESVPTGGEVYIISRSLINWDDVHAVKILKNCRAAMDDSAKLLIIDYVLPNKKVPTFLLLASLNLLVTGGRVMRTEDEYYELLSKACFQAPQLIKTGGVVSFIEAIPG